MKRNPRIIKLKSLRNLRTLAGIETKDGKTIKRDILLRSAALDHITPEDFATLRDQYKLKKVIDLRTKGEAEKKPDMTYEGVEYCYIPVCPDAIPGVSREIEPGQDKALELIPDLVDIYLGVVKGEEYIENISKSIRAIMQNEEGAVLWHCTAGKDRCGFVTVFILWMLGVDMTVIKEDYLLTNLDAIKDARKYYWLVRIFKRNKAIAKRVYAAYMADLKYLDSALGYVKEQGGMDEFIENKLKISREEIENFREKALN